MATQAAPDSHVAGSGDIAGDRAAPGKAVPAPAPAPSAPATGWGLPLLVLIVGMFMSILDITIVNVAIPTIQNEFGATVDEVQWVATAYTLTEGVVVPVSAWLSDRFGLSRVYNLSLLGFAVGSGLCGLAWSLNTLVAFRILQAVLGGILPVVTLAMVYRIVPRERIGVAMGLYGLGIVFAPAVGPTLGGYLVEYVNWRLIFFINVPIGILGTVAALMTLPSIPPEGARRFDLLGFLTVATGLFSLLLALSEGQKWGWDSYRILMLFTLSALCLALFVVIELEVDEPLLDVRVFRYWQFTNSLLLISVLSIGLFAVLFYLPLLLQQAQGMGAFHSGLVLLPQALVMAVLMPIAGLLYDRIGPRWPAAVGVLIVAVGTYWLHVITVDASSEEIMWLLAFRAGGMGLAMMPIFTGGLASVPMSDVNAGSAFNNVIQRTSAALGVAVFTALMSGRQTQLLADRSALMPMGTPMPQLGAGPEAEVAGLFAVYQQTQVQVFVTALDQLFIITAVVTALGVALALFLRTGRAPDSGEGSGMTAMH